MHNIYVTYGIDGSLWGSYLAALMGAWGSYHAVVPASHAMYRACNLLRACLACLLPLPGGVHFDLVKRVLRDISRSGQGPEEIIQQV